MSGSDARRSEGNLEEIIVTAARRGDQRLQDVPISVSVLSGDALDQSTASGVSEALNRVPGVAAMPANQAGGTQLSVRGVGASAPLFNGSSPIAYYLDSVPFGLIKTAIAPDSNAYDLERVEVLRGPQGTLYGATAQNGVVRVLTNDPNLEEFALKARTAVSTTKDGGDNYRGDMAVNVPLIDGKLAVRGVVGYENLGGWIDNPVREDVNDATLRSYRLKVKAQVSDSLAIGLSAWNSHNDYGSPSAASEGNVRSGVLSEAGSTDFEAYGLRLGYDSERFSVSSMTSYLDYFTFNGLDLTPAGVVGLRGETNLWSKIFSQEVLVSSAPSGSWRWSLGAFYREGDDRLMQRIPELPLAPGADLLDGSESYAGFGEVGRRFANDRFEWTIGMRYFHDRVVNVPKQGPPGVPLLRQTSTFDSTTPRLVLSWYPSGNLTAYASYAEGFRSGFPQNPDVARQFPNFPPVEPDKLHNYEIGVKADLLDSRLALEAAVYFMRWEDVQQTLYVLVNGNPVSAPVNGESASGVGVDVGLTARPTEGLALGLNASWNDLTLDDLIRGFPAGAPPEGFIIFEKGDRLNYSPEFTVGASADYTFSVGSRFNGNFSAAANYISEQSNRGFFGPLYNLTGDDFLIARTSFSVGSADDRWVATLFLDNALNEDGATPPVVPLFDWSPRMRPRTYGLQFEFSF